MTTWLPLLLLLPLLVPLFALVWVWVRRYLALPQIAVGRGTVEGSAVFAIDLRKTPTSIYRMRLGFSNPEGLRKEGFLTVTLDPPRTESFALQLVLPEAYRFYQTGEKGIVTVDFRSTGTDVFIKNFSTRRWRNALAKPLSSNSVPLPVEIDLPSVSSLAYSELEVRKTTLLELRKTAEARAATREARVKTES